VKNSHYRVIFFLMASTLFSQTATGPEIYTLEGISTDWFNPSYPEDFQDTTFIPLAVQTQDVASAITSRNPSHPFAVVAHSQGGLKALAFAKLLTDAGNTTRLRGIVTVGSPVKGFSPLRNGVDYTANQFREQLRIIDNADRAARKAGAYSNAASFVNAYAIFLFWQGFFIDNAQQQEGVRKALDFLIKWQYFTSGSVSEMVFSEFLPEGAMVRDFIDLIRSGNSRSRQVLEDMRPGSAFAKNNIGPQTTTIPAEGYWAVFIKTIRIFWKTYIIKGHVWIQTKPPVTTVTPLIDPSVPLGFVVGTDSDPHNILGNAGISLNKGDLSLMAYAGSVVSRNAEYSMNILAGIEWVCNFWRFWDSSALNRHREAKEMAEDAQRMRWTFEDIERDGLQYFYKRYILTDRHDGFIPQYDQTRDVNEVGGQAIVPNRYKVEVNANHITEMSDPRIWGLNGGLSADGQRIHRFVNGTDGTESEMFKMMQGAGLETDILADSVNYVTIDGPAP